MLQFELAASGPFNLTPACSRYKFAEIINMYIKFLLIVILNTSIAMLTSFSNHNTGDTAKIPEAIIDKKGFAV